MKTVVGTYYRGKLRLKTPIKSDKPLKVTITYEEDNDQRLIVSDFSFLETQELLKDCKGSFSDEVIEERRNAL